MRTTKIRISVYAQKRRCRRTRAYKNETPRQTSDEKASLTGRVPKVGIKTRCEGAYGKNQKFLQRRKRFKSVRVKNLRMVLARNRFYMLGERRLGRRFYHCGDSGKRNALPLQGYAARFDYPLDVFVYARTESPQPSGYGVAHFVRCAYPYRRNREYRQIPSVFQIFEL